MNRLTPNVRKSGRYIIFDSTPDAKTVKNAPRQKTRAMPHDDVHAVALQRMPRRGRGRPPVNEIRGYYSIQFGQYQGQTFRWLVENDMGYVTQLLVQVEKEGGNTGGGSLNDNKRQLKVS